MEARANPLEPSWGASLDLGAARLVFGLFHVREFWFEKLGRIEVANMMTHFGNSSRFR